MSVNQAVTGAGTGTDGPFYTKIWFSVVVIIGSVILVAAIIVGIIVIPRMGKGSTAAVVNINNEDIEDSSVESSVVEDPTKKLAEYQAKIRGLKEKALKAIKTKKDTEVDLALEQMEKLYIQLKDKSKVENPVKRGLTLTKQGLYKDEYEKSFKALYTDLDAQQDTKGFNSVLDKNYSNLKHYADGANVALPSKKDIGAAYAKTAIKRLEEKMSEVSPKGTKEQTKEVLDEIDRLKKFPDLENINEGFYNTDLSDSAKIKEHCEIVEKAKKELQELKEKYEENPNLLDEALKEKIEEIHSTLEGHGVEFEKFQIKETTARINSASVQAVTAELPKPLASWNSFVENPNYLNFQLACRDIASLDPDEPLNLLKNVVDEQIKETESLGTTDPLYITPRAMQAYLEVCLFSRTQLKTIKSFESTLSARMYKLLRRAVSMPPVMHLTILLTSFQSLDYEELGNYMDAAGKLYNAQQGLSIPGLVDCSGWNESKLIVDKLFEDETLVEYVKDCKDRINRLNDDNLAEALSHSEALDLTLLDLSKQTQVNEYWKKRGELLIELLEKLNPYEKWADYQTNSGKEKLEALLNEVQDPQSGYVRLILEYVEMKKDEAFISGSAEHNTTYAAQRRLIWQHIFTLTYDKISSNTKSSVTTYKSSLTMFNITDVEFDTSALGQAVADVLDDVVLFHGDAIRLENFLTEALRIDIEFDKQIEDSLAMVHDLEQVKRYLLRLPSIELVTPASDKLDYKVTSNATILRPLFNALKPEAVDKCNEIAMAVKTVDGLEKKDFLAKLDETIAQELEAILPFIQMKALEFLASEFLP